MKFFQALSFIWTRLMDTYPVETACYFLFRAFSTVFDSAELTAHAADLCF